MTEYYEDEDNRELHELEKVCGQLNLDCLFALVKQPNEVIQFLLFL